MSNETNQSGGPDSPIPTPKAEKPQLLPGGADSLEDPKYGDTPGDPVPRDHNPEANPAVDDEAPAEVKEPDDKQQEPDSGTSGEGDTPDDEPSA